MEVMVFRLPEEAIRDIEKHAKKDKLPVRTWIRQQILKRLDVLDSEEKAKESE